MFKSTSKEESKKNRKYTAVFVSFLSIFLMIMISCIYYMISCIYSEIAWNNTNPGKDYNHPAYINTCNCYKNNTNPGKDYNTQQQSNSYFPGIGPNTIADIVEYASPAVVKIETVVPTRSDNLILNDPFFRYFFGDQLDPFPQQRTGLGSGFIISEEGYILTNEHVIDDASEIYVYIKGRKQPVPAKVVGADFDLDLAVLKIDPLPNLPTLKLGNSENIRVGEWVIAIGSPYGLEATVTVGVISAKERPVRVQDRKYEHLLQTDASINPGNSGGPLLNLRGEVIGINTAVNIQAQGIGFAIPSSTVKAVLDQLIEKGRIIRPWLGVYIQTVTPRIASYFDLKYDYGAMVVEVHKGSPAYRAGIRPGDVIIGLDGVKVTTADEIIDIIRSKKVGEALKIKLVDSRGKEREMSVVLTERPANIR
ncbi:trypsin-like peptidase domain-containing protein [Peptococcaceae bacterium]|nr:trypsin-like peptidase domain-containing protein [Peptococcaceae bacterium]